MGWVYKSIILSVCHHFKISDMGPLYHPRITPDPTYHILLGRGWCQLSSGDVNDTHKDKYKVLQRPNVCYIFEEQGVQGFKIWHGHEHVGHGRDGHGRGGHKYKFKDKDTDTDNYNKKIVPCHDHFSTIIADFLGQNKALGPMVEKWSWQGTKKNPWCFPVLEF